MNRLIFFSIAFFACSNVESDKLGETREGRPDAESWNATITLTNKGSKSESSKDWKGRLGL